MRKIVITLTLFYSLVVIAQTNLEACKKTYERIYADGELTMSLYYGYSESDDYVDDRIQKAEMIDKIKKPCGESSENQLCGFNRDPDNADLFTKTITRSDGKTELIKLKLRSSSVSTNDQANKGKLRAQQEKYSKETEEAFYRSLQTDDVVFYNGHARRGTGPGFSPMETPDWINAITNKPSLERTKSALQSAAKTPAIIGMITCDGEQHYGQALQLAAPLSGLLLTRQTTSFADTDPIIEAAFEGILQKRCSEAFRTSLQNSVKYIYNSPFDSSKSYKDKLPEIYNFFETNTKPFPAPRGALLTLINEGFEEFSTRDREAAKERLRQPQQPLQQPTENPR